MSTGMNPYKRILIINIYGIGDVLFTTPLLQALHQNFPEAKIDYICNRRALDILSPQAFINECIVYERDEWHKIKKQSLMRYLKKLLSFQKMIYERHYDLVFDLSLNSQFILLTFIARIKERVGLNYRNRSPLLTRKIDLYGFEDKPVVEYYLDLLPLLGCKPTTFPLSFPVSKEDEEWARVFFKKNKINPKKKIVGIIPGGGASWGPDAVDRRWPGEKFAKLADKLIEKFCVQIILFGDSRERELCENVRRSMQNACLVACGEANLGQFAAFLKACTLVILNDGGPLHIAMAVRSKVVAIFGPVNENVYGPYPPDGSTVVNHATLCRPCYKRFRRSQCDHISCLRQLSEENVLLKIEELGYLS